MTCGPGRRWLCEIDYSPVARRNPLSGKHLSRLTFVPRLRHVERVALPSRSLLISLSGSGPAMPFRVPGRLSFAGLTNLPEATTRQNGRKLPELTCLCEWFRLACFQVVSFGSLVFLAKKGLTTLLFYHFSPHDASQYPKKQPYGV
jgi:hypothetical protein